jgi:arylsulfatase A-like enzyme
VVQEGKGKLAENRPKNTETGRGPAWESLDVDDEQLGDGLSAKRAVELLNELKDKRFFLAVGFYKPHLPFVAPKRYYDLYPLESIRTAKNPFPPKNAPKFALTSGGELRSYAEIPEKGPISEDQARELIRGYYAATSYTDAQIGRVLDELETLGLDENTIVCVWGDHGWKLGEHGAWCKHTNFELDTNAPLIFRVPDQRRPDGESDALVEFVDVYPTLAELCGLPAPEGVEGTSLASLIDNPDREWKTAAFSQYPRGDVMGYSMRTDRYRYTEWQNKQTGEVEARELYDHDLDPDENENVAGAEANQKLVAKLGEQLKAGWKGALPPK